MALISDDLVYIRLADNEGDTTQTSLHVAQQADAVARTALFTAIEGVTLGATVERGYQDRAYENAVRRSTNPLAQSDIRWRLIYTGVSGNTPEYAMPIGTADLSLKKDGEEVMDNTLTEYTDLKTAFDAIARLPDQSEAAVLVRVEYYKA